MLPICCYNCGKCISKYEEIFEELLQKNEKKDDNIDKILKEIGITKMCCRILFLTYINECKLLIK